MKKFLAHSFRFAKVGVLFFIMLMVLYLSMDPFKVLYHYDRFVEDNAKAYIVLNRDYVSTKTFDNNYKERNYNAFIFGNSRSIFYEVDDWYQEIGSDNSAFHFDASSESLFALQKKIQYIESKGVSIDHVLLVVDAELLELEKPNKDALFEISPQLMDNENFIAFHFTYLKTFCSPKFFIPATYYQLTGHVFPFFKNTLDFRQRTYDPITNELQFGSFEKMIDDDNFYTDEKKEEFYQREKTVHYSEPSIKENQKILLQEIYEVLKKHNTTYKIIINPLYDQIKLNKTDLTYLNSLFGAQHVFDFSGINSYTKDFYNYYDWSHYRPHVAKDIMKTIYSEQ